MPVWEVILLGLVEGLAEFIPVSSTGHLLLLGHFRDFNSPGKTFEVLVQLGAILAIMLIYARKVIKIALALPFDPRARRFVLGTLLTFLPAAVIGALAHSIIKNCLALIVGGLCCSSSISCDSIPGISMPWKFPQCEHSRSASASEWQ
jgi:undecaprenyl-diphosphatase